jgi:hypothetical protein
MRRLVAFALLCACLRATAAPVELSDDELAKVEGQEGVSLVIHLELNSSLLEGSTDVSRLVAGFNVNGTRTYAVMKDLGGVADLFGVTLDVHARPDLPGGSYVDLGLPVWVGFRDFGFRALAATTDPNATITPANSYGQLLLNGSASVTGHVYIWAAP